MQKFEISDRALKEAAGAVVTSLLGALPEPEELAHDFSDGFEEKMRLVIAKEKRHSAFRKFGRRAAAVILAALVGMGAWLAVDQEARAMVSQWIRTVYESSVIYRFFESGKRIFGDSALHIPQSPVGKVPAGKGQACLLSGCIVADSPQIQRQNSGSRQNANQNNQPHMQTSREELSSVSVTQNPTQVKSLFFKGRNRVRPRRGAGSGGKRKETRTQVVITVEYPALRSLRSMRIAFASTLKAPTCTL